MDVFTELLVLACICPALAVCAWSDLVTRTVPDMPVACIAGAGVLMRAMAGSAALASSIAVAALLFLLLVLAHARGLLGGGDVKLIAATALCVPPQSVMHLVSAIALCGGMLALLHLALRRLPQPVPCCPPHAPALLRVCRIERWRIHRHGPLPYAVAIAAGAGWVLLSNIAS